MSTEQKKIALRNLVSVLVVLLAATPVTQALAQAAQQESGASEAQESEELSATPAAAEPSEGGATLVKAPVSEADTVQLLRLGAASIFPIAALSVHSEHAAPTPAEISTAGSIAIVVLVIVAILAVVVVVPHLQGLGS